MIMPVDTSGWGPPPPKTLDDQPPIRDLVGCVVAMIGPRPLETDVKTKAGPSKRIRLERLVVFDRGTGEMSDYEDYAIWQSNLQSQITQHQAMGKGPVMVGRLRTSGQSFELEDITSRAALLERVADGLETGGFLPASNPRTPDREHSYEQARQIMRGPKEEVDDGF